MSPHPGGPSDDFDDLLGGLAELLDAEGIDAPVAGAPIVRRARGTAVPMSFSQELLWLLDRATPGLTAYNLPIVRRLRGSLDVHALARALAFLVERHESLRMRFADVGGSPQLIVDAEGTCALDVVELDGTSAELRTEQARAHALDLAKTPFDLTRDLLFRPVLLRIDPADHVLVLLSHHIVLDGWSMGVLFRELAVAYSAYLDGSEPDLPPLQVDFGDYAIWQREQLAGEHLEELLDFWRGQLGDAAEPLNLPTDFPRQPTPTFAGARESLHLSADETARLRSFATQHNATLYVALLSAYAIVLHRYTGAANVLIGSGSAGRTPSETELLVGYLSNTIVQRADMSGDPTVTELVGRVRASALAGYDHQDIPLEKLVLELRQGKDQLADAPLFEVVLTMQETLGARLTLGAVVVSPFGIDAAATKFDVTVLASELPDGLHLTAQYRSELFAPDTMRRFLGHLRTVLISLTTNAATRLSSLEMLTADERSQLDGWNATDVDEGAPSTITARFEHQVTRRPTSTALVGEPSGGRTALTYDELNASANQLAHHLIDLGVGHSAPVGLLMDRSVDAIVALLAILKANGAYVPLPVEAPSIRLARQVADSGISIVVAAAEHAGKLPSHVRVVITDDAKGRAALDRLATSNPSAQCTPDDLAYVLYTSGSTGTPKGVAVSHANVVHYARAISRVLAGGEAGRIGDALDEMAEFSFGLVSTLAADLGNTSILPALLGGGTLHVLSIDASRDPARFATYMQDETIDVVKITPGHIAALTVGKTGSDLARVLPRRWLVVGGETLRPSAARALLSAGSCRLLNHYGPTETTVGVCTFEVTAATLVDVDASGAHSLPIGRPLANTHAYVVDADGNEMPVSMPGELLIGGKGVTAGYLGRNDLTAEKFVQFRGERVYRTGDRVRRLHSGAIEFLKRTDEQVKLRGYRVELGDVEQVARAHSGIEAAIAVALADDDGASRLRLYAVPRRRGRERDASQYSERATTVMLTAWMSARLPSYMLPDEIFFLDELPLTANGKVDRSRLSSFTGEATSKDNYVAPSTDVERQLAVIWSDVLKKERIGIHDTFLALGGHSLMAIRVLGKISRTFGVRLPLRVLFDSPTIEQLAIAIESARTADAPAPSIASVSREAHRITSAMRKATP